MQLIVTGMLLLMLPIGCTPAKMILGDEDGSPDGGGSDTDTPSDDDTGAGDPTDDDSGDPGDPGDSGDPGDTGDPPGGEPVEVDYRELGPYSTSTSSMTLSASCSSDVVITAPTAAGAWPRVVLAHGFMRGTAQMVGWADHLASWGLEVVVPSLCHSSITGTNHEQNGFDLVTFHDTLGGGPVVYAGHSAGGLAALIAASRDGSTVGLVGLDLTDADGLGLSYADEVTAPGYALAGEASSCNNDGNGVSAVGAVADATVVRLTDADHCDFENETDWMCTTFCPEGGETFSNEQIQHSVLGLMTSAVMGLTGQDSDAVSMWWRAGGTFFDTLQASGEVSAL